MVGARMQRKSVMFPEPLWQMVQDEAEAQGVNASQLIREAALAVIYYERGDYKRIGEPLAEARRDLRQEITSE